MVIKTLYACVAFLLQVYPTLIWLLRLVTVTLVQPSIVAADFLFCRVALKILLPTSMTAVWLPL